MLQQIYCTWSQRAQLPPDLRSRFRDLDEFLRSLITSARSKLLLVSPYLSTGGIVGLRRSIAVAAQNQVWIKLVTSVAADERSGTQAAIRLLLDGPEGQLIRPRLRILQAAPQWTDLVHAKCIVVDGKTGYLGSANFSVGGLDRHFEIGVALSSSSAAALDKLVAYVEGAGGLIDSTQALAE